MGRKTYKGRFHPANLEKYKGNAANVVFRSSWEYNVMSFFDKTPSVLEWSSEEHVIPYISPIDQRPHRYYVDFWAKLRTKTGDIVECLIEVKPYAQTQPPPKPKRMTKSYAESVETYFVNRAKWDAASRFCSENGMKFWIITEKNLHFKCFNRKK